jgi:hypothetical protein
MTKLLILLALTASCWAQEIRPGRPFSLVETLKMLDDGSCTLRGTALVQDEDGVHPAEIGDRVIVVPYTPYLAEYFDLVGQHGPGKVAIDPGIASCCIITPIADQKGGFTVPHLKPGRYLVSTVVRWQVSRTRTWTEKHETGRQEAYNAFGQLLWSNPTFTKTQHSQAYRVADVRRLVGMVEFTSENQVLDLLLKGE